MSSPYDTGPAGTFKAVVPGDNLITPTPRALYVGTTGDVHVKSANDVDGATVVFVGVVAGTILPIRPGKVLGATTADDIVALY